MKSITKNLIVAFMMLGAIISFIRCSDDTTIDPTTTTITNMYSYVKSNETSSLFASVIEKAGYNVFMDAYGTYTLFLPTDAAVKTYLTTIGKGSVDNLSQTEAQNIVKVHLVKDTLSTIVFTDGKLNTPNLYGQYLLTGAAVTASGSQITINRTSNIILSNQRVGNGIIHVIDKVMIPATKTLAQLIEGNTDYSIFTQALKETGYFDTLNSTSVPVMTVVAETNAALAKAGYTSYAQLKARFSKTGNPKLVSDSLNLYVAYHIIDQVKYMGDLVAASTHLTRVTTEPTIVSVVTAGDSILVNDDTYSGKREVGASLNRANSDVGAVNGVLHESQKHYNIKLRLPTRIDWDLCDFPELKKLTTIYRKANYSFTNEVIPGWERTIATQPVSYSYNGSSPASGTCKDKDALDLPLGVVTGSIRNLYIKMNTPIIPKGKYKVWVCYRFYQRSTNTKNVGVSFYVDDQLIGTHNMMTKPTLRASAGEMEAEGWKCYMYKAPVAPATFDGDVNLPGKMVGFANVTSTGQHRFKFEAVNDGSQSVIIDMIQFIPVNDNQTSPRFNLDGTLVY